MMVDGPARNSRPHNFRSDLYRSMRRHRHYLMSFHGQDIGLQYRLPPNVRVFMHCWPGETVSAADFNEARTWFVATLPEHDAAGQYMATLALDSSEHKHQQYCCFSGDLGQELDMVPDLHLQDESVDFRTGLYQLPVRLQRHFVRSHYSAVDRRLYAPGDVVPLDNRKMNLELQRYCRTGSRLPPAGFVRLLLDPAAADDICLGETGFVVLPDPRRYSSYLGICQEAEVAPPPTHGIPRNIWKTRQHDASTPNTKNRVVAARVRRIHRETPGLYLSDVIRCLVSRYPDDQLTLIVSACRCFHDDIPPSVKHRQRQTRRFTVDRYLALKKINQLPR